MREVQPKTTTTEAMESSERDNTTTDARVTLRMWQDGSDQSEKLSSNSSRHSSIPALTGTDDVTSSISKVSGDALSSYQQSVDGESEARSAHAPNSSGSEQTDGAYTDMNYFAEPTLGLSNGEAFTPMTHSENYPPITAFRNRGRKHPAQYLVSTKDRRNQRTVERGTSSCSSSEEGYMASRGSGGSTESSVTLSVANPPEKRCKTDQLQTGEGDGASQGDSSDDMRDYRSNSSLEDSSDTGSDTCPDPSKPQHASSTSQEQKLPYQASDSPIFMVDLDIMVHILSFLHPTQVLRILNMPLSKGWYSTFSSQPTLWRSLCQTEPFNADLSEDDELFEASVSSTAVASSAHVEQLYPKFQYLYASFVRCMRYLSQVQDGVLNGKLDPYIDFGLLQNSEALQRFFAQVRQATTSESQQPQEIEVAQAPIEGNEGPGLRWNGSRWMLDPRTDAGLDGRELVWSCAVYSIVNWMVSHQDVEGIQTMCMQVLPLLLETDEQRLAGQRAGVGEMVVRSMINFPDSVKLLTAACHTIVLLTRPIGGREGMLYNGAKVPNDVTGHESGDSSNSTANVIIKTMTRFEENAELQAMGCWSLVNISLVPAWKSHLVRNGAIQAILKAMRHHEKCFVVQFRALFALINLIIPCVNDDQDGNLFEGNVVFDPVEMDIIGKFVDDVVKLVVRAMNHFRGSEVIMNRACLVLHNISLVPLYHSVLLETDNCCRLLEWCLENYRSDHVLQQSASGTIARLRQSMARQSRNLG
eukprot:Nitzschia sp. Nitz4//scaffold77_size91520//76689//79220//NITZ4_004903-RA/size91520-augustus-gene-0.70-mRNA-1//1//CDS//3329558030//927//frame0